ncbi:MAG: PQQ-binding-like beta-propeller repeat protein, partial [Candidatus Coatesbacteria bacterium]|nr:PQQ-binding-like beta-propeller repeat protein [Candidatus Coatesbacteria bacterium]
MILRIALSLIFMPVILFSAPGDLIWRYKTGDNVSSSPCVSDGVVYVGSHDHYLYAINCSSGTPKWRYQTGSGIGSSPCVSDGVVYIGSDDKYLHALNNSDGA